MLRQMTSKKRPAFRAAFRSSAATARADDARVEVGVRGEEGPLALAANSPFFAPEKIEPQQPAAVLAVDGRDIGAEILGDVPGLAAYRAELARMKKELEENRIYVRGIRPVRWEAEKGVVTLKMRVEKDGTASGGAYVWTPGEIGSRGIVPGSVSWQLEVKDAGTYRLWGRVLAPTPNRRAFP